MPVYTASLSPTSPRHGDWVKVFGADPVPVKEPTSHPATLPGLGERPVYLIDVDKLPFEQWERLVQWAAKKFGDHPRDVDRRLRSEGFPILADDVSVTIDARAFL